MIHLPINPPTINDIFPNWMIGDGIFKFINVASPSVPWNDYIMSEDLDIMYHGQHSGEKYATKFLSYFIDKETGTYNPDTILSLAKAINSRYAQKWNALWKLYQYEHNPLTNISVTEIETLSESLDNTSSSLRTPNISTDTTLVQSTISAVLHSPDLEQNVMSIDTLKATSVNSPELSSRTTSAVDADNTSKTTPNLSTQSETSNNLTSTSTRTPQLRTERVLDTDTTDNTIQRPDLSSTVSTTVTSGSTQTTIPGIVTTVSSTRTLAESGLRTGTLHSLVLGEKHDTLALSDAKYNRSSKGVTTENKDLIRDTETYGFGFNSTQDNPIPESLARTTDKGTIAEQTESSSTDTDNQNSVAHSDTTNTTENGTSDLTDSHSTTRDISVTGFSGQDMLTKSGEDITATTTHNNGTDTTTANGTVDTTETATTSGNETTTGKETGITTTTTTETGISTTTETGTTTTTANSITTGTDTTTDNQIAQHETKSWQLGKETTDTTTSDSGTTQTKTSGTETMEQSNNSTRAFTRSKSTTGSRVTSVATELSLYRDYWLNDYFETVFADIDKYIALALY